MTRSGDRRGTQLTLPDWLRRPWKRPGGGVPAAVPNRRGTPRFDVNQPVSIGGQGRPPVEGSLINISMSGAAVHVYGWNVPDSALWPTRPVHGNELWLAGLLDVAIPCWVIAVEDAMLRVRFLLDETLRNQLRDKIESLAPG